MTTSLTIELGGLDGADGFTVAGSEPLAVSGRSVAGAGDINADGIDDIAIGAFGASPTAPGEAYVVFGTSTGFPALLSPADLDGSNGFVITGAEPRDWAGRMVASAGDVNGDGIGDLLVSAPTADPGGVERAGVTYVVFGSDTGFPAELAVADLDGSNGFAITGASEHDWAGVSTAGAGDVNGDGIDDIVIGADGASPGGVEKAGESYVVFGTAAGFPASLDLAALDGSNGFALEGIGALDFSGFPVAGIGDFNGDGLGDIAIGARLADPGGVAGAGQSHIVFGRNDGFPATIDLAALDGMDGFTIDGIAAGDSAGFWVAGAGDINGDGIDDLAVGARFADPDGRTDAGQSYVVFGTGQPLAAEFDLADLDGTNGFTINGIDPGDESGTIVTGAGDFNGDGLDDLLVGALYADPDGAQDAGETYLVFGSATGFAPVIDLSGLDRDTGLVFVGAAAGDASGHVSAAGDVNGDGFDDIVIGADKADPGGDTAAGESYVVFGFGDDDDVILGGSQVAGHSDNEGYDAVDPAAPAAADEVDFGRGDDLIGGGAGDDALSGGDGNDVLYGELGRDEIFGDLGDDLLSGGDDRDRLFGGAGDDTLDGGAGRDALSGGTGADLLTGGNGADVFLFALGDEGCTITDFTPGSDVLVLLGVPAGVGLSEIAGLAFQDGADVVLSYGTDEIRLEDTALGDIGAGDVLLA